MKLGYSRRTFSFLIPLVLLACAVRPLMAENCLTASDLDDATHSALVAAAQRDFDHIAKGDSASLRQNATPSLASDFASIEAAVKDNQSALASSKAAARSSFLLEAEGTSAIAHAEFLCGVFGKNGQTAGSAVFHLDDLAPGRYGVVILDASSANGSRTVSLILQQQSSDWKLEGLYIRQSQAAGHDSAWYAMRAREFKNKSQMYNAWLYFLEARWLASPLPFMSTSVTDKLYDESEKLQSADLPSDGKTVDLSSGKATYKLTAIFPDAVENDLDLVVKYAASDISNTNQTYQSNVAVMKALVAKFPELREGFAGMIARAVDPSGRDYGTLRAMKDIK
jgi:hypothetical protein